jgi:SAM-dependent methyltransferase
MADETVATPRVLDPCCGSRMWWFDRQHPDAIYGDRRTETLTVTDRSHGRQDGQRVLRIEPDQVMDFRALPFPDGTFKLVAFDPPHLVRAGPRSWLAAKYGKLGQDWRDDLRQGFAECFRVLDTDGVLVFKWNETQVRIAEVLALTPHRPLFGNTSGKKAGTHWMVFMKPGSAAACGVPPVEVPRHAITGEPVIPGICGMPGCAACDEARRVRAALGVSAADGQTVPPHTPPGQS